MMADTSHMGPVPFGERLKMHGTLIVYIRRAEHLGQSHVLPDYESEPEPNPTHKKNKFGSKLENGLRFVGKKALNAARTTNHVRPILGTSLPK